MELKWDIVRTKYWSHAIPPVGTERTGDGEADVRMPETLFQC